VGTVAFIAVAFGAMMLGMVGVVYMTLNHLVKTGAITITPPPSQPSPADVEAFVALPEQRIAQEIPEIETRLAKHPRFKDLPSADRKAAAEELAQKAAMHLGRYRRGV